MLQPGPAAGKPPESKTKEEAEAEDDSKFDEFMGGDGALLAGTTGEYDRDDKEADDVWESVDAFMDGRRRVWFSYLLVAAPSRWNFKCFINIRRRATYGNSLSFGKDLLLCQALGSVFNRLPRQVISLLK